MEAFKTKTLGTCTSTTAAEYEALFYCAEEVVSMRNFLGELGYPQTEPTVIYEDNAAALALVNGPGKLHHRTKSMALRFHKLREYRADGIINVTSISTKDNTADIGTKNLPKPIFVKHCSHVAVLPDDKIPGS